LRYAQDLVELVDGLLIELGIDLAQSLLGLGLIGSLGRVCSLGLRARVGLRGSDRLGGLRRLRRSRLRLRLRSDRLARLRRLRASHGLGIVAWVFGALLAVVLEVLGQLELRQRDDLDALVRVDLLIAEERARRLRGAARQLLVAIRQVRI